MRRKRLIRPTFGNGCRPDKTRQRRIRHCAPYRQMQLERLIRPTNRFQAATLSAIGPLAPLCLLYTNPHPGICDVCQSALGGLFPSGSFLPPRQRFFELFPHPLIFSYISFSSGLLWYFLIVIHGLTSSLDMPVSVIRVVHDALCHWPLLSLSMQVFLL